MKESAGAPWTDADLRVHRGLDRLSVRGLARVNTVVLLAALTFNVLRVRAWRPCDRAPDLAPDSPPGGPRCLSG